MSKVWDWVFVLLEQIEGFELLVFGSFFILIPFIILIIILIKKSKRRKEQQSLSKNQKCKPKRTLSNSESFTESIIEFNDSSICEKEREVELLLQLLTMSFKSISLIDLGNRLVSTLSDYYNMDYVTLYLKGEDGWFSTLSTNMPKFRVRKTERFYNKESIGMVSDSKVIVVEGFEDYGKLRSFNVEYSNFTIIKQQGTIIGALLLEHSDKSEVESNENQLSIYDKVFNSTALVLGHFLEVSNLIKEVSTDQLTNVYNRRFIDLTLKEEISKHSNLGQSCHIAMMDIDYFKKFNDTYGHQFGDEVLRVVSKYIKDKLGEHSWVARYGGEEFLVFIANSNIDKVYMLINSIGEGISKLEVVYIRQSASVTVSFGIAGFPKDGANAESIIANADKALYKSKENGRNRVTVWGD